MKQLSIYIEHVPQDNEFVKELMHRLNSLKDTTVKAYLTIDENGMLDNWQESVSMSITEADIIIPIISASFISAISNDIEIEMVFSNAVNDDNKYVLPILLSPSDWGSISWIVRSTMIPEDSQPLSEYKDNEKDKILNLFIKKINNIITKYKLNSLNNKKQKASTISTDNVIFISHDHDDADFAELLKLRLEKENLNAWIDSEHLKIGQDWREEIDQGIKDSIAVIVVMTPDARKSEYVTYEWAFAWGKEKKIFPIMLKQTQLHPRLESLQYLDFTNRASRPWDKLIESLKDLLSE